MYMLDGVPISNSEPFQHGDVAYPPGWLATSSPEEREALGITEVPDPVPIDPRFYYDVDVPRPIEDVQAMFLTDIKATAQVEIYKKYPAWHQSNVTSRGVEIATMQATGRVITPKEVAEVAAYGVIWGDIQAMRDHSDDLEAEMLALTFEELTTWQQHGWPSQTPIDEITPLPAPGPAPKPAPKAAPKKKARGKR